MTIPRVGLLTAIVGGFSCMTFTSGASVVDVCQRLATAVQPIKTFYANTYISEAAPVNEAALNQLCSADDDDDIETLKTDCQDMVVVTDFENYAYLETYFCSTSGRKALGELHQTECFTNGYSMAERLRECARLHFQLSNVEDQACNAMKAWFECARARLAEDCDPAFANITMNGLVSFNVPIGPEPLRPCLDAY